MAKAGPPAGIALAADPDAPISAVAEHAGVGISALYRRYENKEDLLRRLSGDGLRRYIAEAEAALADDGDDAADRPQHVGQDQGKPGCCQDPPWRSVLSNQSVRVWEFLAPKPHFTNGYWDVGLSSASDNEAHLFLGSAALPGPTRGGLAMRESTGIATHD